MALVSVVERARSMSYIRWRLSQKSRSGSEDEADAQGGVSGD